MARDKPTQPLSYKQTPGGYKVIEDAEGRHICFLSMDEEDASWAKYLVKRANAHDQLVAAIRKTRERHIAKAKRVNFDDCGCDDCLVLGVALAQAEE